MRTKENVVAGGTIVKECGANYLVVVDAPYDSNTPLPIPIPIKQLLQGMQLVMKFCGHLFWSSYTLPSW